MARHELGHRLLCLESRQEIERISLVPSRLHDFLVRISTAIPHYIRRHATLPRLRVERLFVVVAGDSFPAPEVGTIDAICPFSSHHPKSALLDPLMLTSLIFRCLSTVGTGRGTWEPLEHMSESMRNSHGSKAGNHLSGSRFLHAGRSTLSGAFPLSSERLPAVAQTTARIR